MQDHAGEGFLIPKLRPGNIVREILIDPIQNIKASEDTISIRNNNPCN